MARKATNIQLKIIFMKASIFNSLLLVVLKCWALDSSRLWTQTAFYATAFHSPSSCRSVRGRVFKSGSLNFNNACRQTQRESAFILTHFLTIALTFYFTKPHTV